MCICVKAKHKTSENYDKLMSVLKMPSGLNAGEVEICMQMSLHLMHRSWSALRKFITILN